MLDRCYRPKHPRFHRYGGRDELGGVSISVCERWRFGEGDMSAFECFLADMGERPAEKTLDRKKSSDDYGPLTCRWATALEQANNLENTKRLEIDGELMTISEAVDRYNMPRRYFPAVMRRIWNGWELKRAVTTAIGNYRP